MQSTRIEGNRIFENLISKLKPTLCIDGDKGYGALKKHLSSEPEKILESVKASGLRGRGGAGFSTATKWSFMPKATDMRPNYLVVNADESEPGTCKDRSLMEYEPHQIIQGAILASYALGARVCYIYIRGEFVHEYKILSQAISDAYAAGCLGTNILGTDYNLDVVLHRGAGAYICGEETALLESLEGKKGFPRLKPPFPAQKGLYGFPTVVNNVESIAVLPAIIKRGGEWFSSLGRPNNTGTKLYCISGMVNKPCVVEEEMGVSMRYLIDQYAGGVIGGWGNLKAAIPGGASTPMLPANICANVLMDFDSLKLAGSALGTGGIIVFTHEVDLVDAIANLSKFYMKESCGQCSPCREGTGFLWRIMQDIKTNGSSKENLDALIAATKKIEGKTICSLADAAAWPIQGLIKHFGHEIAARKL